MHIALLIAVEQYRDESIPPVTFARNDAERFSDALKELGFENAGQTVLIDSDSTKANVEYKLRQTINTLAEDDVFYLFYAGHGFSENGVNYITCHDTQYADLAGTSVPLQALFTLLRESDCKKSCLFIDSSERGLLANAKMRGIYSDLTDTGLREFFESSEYCVCFAACKSGQKSYPIMARKHGAWTYHLIEALKGNAAEAIEGGHDLSSKSLQKYLEKEVPRALRLAYSDQREQTPCVFGSVTGEFLVADLGELLERRKGAANLRSGPIKKAAFVRQWNERVRSLSGFRKGHTIPQYINSTGLAFVSECAAPEITADLAQVFSKLRAGFKLKRKDLNVSDPGDGTGSIITPYFKYSISVSQDPEDPASVRWHREITEIIDPDKVFTDEFDTVFENVFDRLEFYPSSPIGVDGLIDFIEDLEDDAIQADYAPECTQVTLRIEGVGAEIEVTVDYFALVYSRPQPPSKLVKSFTDIQELLIDKHGMRLIEFNEE